jgi:uncharacterized SAM-binding protein YcdF (DUF218 family)
MALISVIPTDDWLSSKALFSAWWATPPSVILPLLILIGLPYLLRSRRWQRQLSLPAVIVLLIYSVTISPPAVALALQGLTTFVPEDSGTIADAIVVLGRSPLVKDRVQVTAELWQAQRAPRIFSSGKGDAPNLIQELKKKGIPSQALKGEDCSRTTAENAEFTAATLWPEGVRRILLVTDEPHMLRSLLTFRSLGFIVTPHLAPLPPRLSSAQKSSLVMREYLALISYYFLGRFEPKGEGKVANLSANLTKQFSIAKCIVEG